MNDREHWEQERKDYLRSAPERDAREISDLDMAVAALQVKYGKVIKRREATEKRLKRFVLIEN